MCDYPYDFVIPQNMIVGKNIIFLDEITSTNVFAKDMAKKNAPDGTVIFARCQTKGVGSHDRQWFSKSDDGIYMSVIFRPEINARHVCEISSFLAAACKRAVEKSTLLDHVLVKLPNDILIYGKKVCGILTQSCIEGETVQYVIAGIGVNISHKTEDFPEELRSKATSLFVEKGERVYPENVALALLMEIDCQYKAFLDKHR